MIHPSGHYPRPECEPGAITELLKSWQAGDRSGLDRSMPLVMNHLRIIARRQLRSQGSSHTLETSGLINEAYLKMAQAAAPAVCNREHFIALCARIMRQILVDYARRRRRGKRGDGAVHVALEPKHLISDEQVEQALRIDAALDELEKFDERKCRVFELRFFAGFSVQETATGLGVSENTIIRDWAFSCEWLKSRVDEGSPCQMTTSSAVGQRMPPPNSF
ncbi:MAG: ECF-type sigma factor [Acidobacteriota bacterium]|nr:ECF-type sigma factor [Acidobacteriota bacterium]